MNTVSVERAFASLPSPTFTHNLMPTSYTYMCVPQAVLWYAQIQVLSIIICVSGSCIFDSSSNEQMIDRSRVLVLHVNIQFAVAPVHCW